MMKKGLTLVLTLTLMLTLLWVLPSCGKTSSFDSAASVGDKVLNVKKVSLESLCDFSDMITDEHGDDSSIGYSYIAVTDYGIFRFFGTIRIEENKDPTSSHLDAEKHGYIEYYEASKKIKDLTLGDSETSIKKAYRHETAFGNFITAEGRYDSGKEKDVKLGRTDGVYAYIYSPTENAGKEQGQGHYEFFEEKYPEENLTAKDDTEQNSLLSFMLLMWSDRENGEEIYSRTAGKTLASPPDFTVLDSDEILDVKKVSLKSLCDLSDMTFDRIFSEDDEMRNYYTADSIRFVNCIIVVTEDGIFRTFSVTNYPSDYKKPSPAKTYLEFYAPKYKITDLTLGSKIEIERAYRNTGAYHDPFILKNRASYPNEELTMPKENGTGAYIYCFDKDDDGQSYGHCEYFDISAGYPAPKSEDELINDSSATAFIYYMWHMRGTGKQIFDFAAESSKS